MHKITLCQAEGMMKRNRHGKEMTEEELEQNRLVQALKEITFNIRRRHKTQKMFNFFV